MKFLPTPIDGLTIVEVEKRGDERGWFGRVFCTDEFAEAGLEPTFVQVNVSRTALAGTVRGFHYQLPPSVEDKYLRCTRGALFDVGLDLRKGSVTFGQSFGVELTDDNGLGLLLPRGVAHGFQTLVDDAEATYLVSTRYAPNLERGVRHDDPALDIEWPLPVTVVSDKDQSWPDFTPDHAIDLT
ncbi:MAG TPA: dTDP-4-dehydrorhamnose 3,5-epimerase [Acidimicrobiales bacterium]